MKQFNRRMNPIQKAEMRCLYEENYSLGYIARKFQCCTNTVWNTVFDISHSYISAAKKKSIIKSSKVTPKQVRHIRLLAKQGYNAKYIASIYGISNYTTLSIIRGRTFRWVSGWIRHNQNFQYYKPIKTIKQTSKSDVKPGPKLGSKMNSKHGELLTLAKKFKVSTSTIHRWKLKGKLTKKIQESTLTKLNYQLKELRLA